MKILSLQFCFDFYLLWIQSWSSNLNHFDVLCNHRCHGSSVYWCRMLSASLASLYVDGGFDPSDYRCHGNSVYWCRISSALLASPYIDWDLWFDPSISSIFYYVNSFAKQFYLIIIQLGCYACLCTRAALDERRMIRIGCGLWGFLWWYRSSSPQKMSWCFTLSFVFGG